MLQPKDVDNRRGIIGCYYTALIFPMSRFCNSRFTGKVFNKTVLTNFLKSHNGHSRGSVIKKCVNDNQFTEGMLTNFIK